MVYRKAVRLALTLVGLAFAASATAQVKWDLPAAYAPGNFHTENLELFAKDVDAFSDAIREVQTAPRGRKPRDEE